MIHVTANHRDSIFSSVPSPRIFHTIAGFDAVDSLCIAGEDLEKATISTADFGYRFSAKVLERYQGFQIISKEFLGANVPLVIVVSGPLY